MWKDLTVQQKADLMDIFLEKGVHSLRDMQRMYNQFAEGGSTVGELVNALYKSNPREEFLGEPAHHYDFTQSEEWANAHGYYPDARGHRDDRVKKPAHPSHPSRGTWDGNKFILTDVGMENPNYTLFGLNDGGQDSQAVLTYQGGSVIPEITATPNGNYIYNPYDNIRLSYSEGGNLFSGTESHSSQMNQGYVYDILPRLLKDAGLNVRVTSGYRKAGAAGKAGKKSWHTRHGAVDIVPQGKTTFEDIENALYSNPAIYRYMLTNGLGLLDESGRSVESRATMKKTGASGPHFHIGKDTTPARRYAQRISSVWDNNMNQLTQHINTPQPTVTMPEEIPFTPWNPQVLANEQPLVTYTPPILETPEPLVEVANAYTQEALEKEQRQRNLNTLGFVLGMTSLQGSDNSLVNTIGMLTGSGFAKGGKIHIKPSHRGRLTELKKRTGKSEAELYKTGGPAVRKMITFARNARKWKHGLGGNLFSGEDTPTQQMSVASNGVITTPEGIQIFRPYYDYSRTDRPLTRNVELPETVIKPDSTLTPWERNARERARAQAHDRQYGKGTYDALRDKERTEAAVNRAQKKWDNSTEKKVLDAAIGLAEGVGIGSDIVATSMGGAPVYSALKGSQAFGRAVNSGNPLDYAESALWLLPEIGAVGKEVYNTGKTALSSYRYTHSLGEPVVPENYNILSPSVRTRIGDVEIDNPNLLYHLDRGNGVGAFSNQGAYVEDGMLLPGIAKESEVPYSWWNLGRPYATSVNGQPMTRLMTSTKNTPGMLHVRSQNYPIGQWNGKRGLVTNAEYVNPEGVDVLGSTYTLDPGYGWRRVFAEDAPTVKWADATRAPQIVKSNESAQQESLKDIFKWFRKKEPDAAEVAKQYGELGRQDLLDEISSPWYKERWKKATQGSDEQIDDLLSRMKTWIEEVPIDYSKTTKQLDDEPGFVTYGVTLPREPQKYDLPDGTHVTDYNTGLDVFVASNRGKQARDTAYHELQHYLTNKATGTTAFPNLQFITEGPYKPLTTPISDNELLIGRGDAWQHYIMDQNEALLPPRSFIYEEAINDPQKLKDRIINIGETPEEAEWAISKLKDQAQDMMDIQEERAHLKTWFNREIKPHLNNPNDASEIEQLLIGHPDIMENRPEKVKTLMETLRPGSIKDYAKYLAESLGIVPFIMNTNSKEK